MWPDSSNGSWQLALLADGLLQQRYLWTTGHKDQLFFLEHVPRKWAITYPKCYSYLPCVEYEYEMKEDII